MSTRESKPATPEKPYWYPARWNDHNPDEYAAKLAAATDDELRKECNQFIWLSAYASNNPRSDYHWMCDATYDECSKRGKVEIYGEEHKKLSREAERG